MRPGGESKCNKRSHPSRGISRRAGYQVHGHCRAELQSGSLCSTSTDQQRSAILSSPQLRASVTPSASPGHQHKSLKWPHPDEGEKCQYTKERAKIIIRTQTF